MKRLVLLLLAATLIGGPTGVAARDHGDHERDQVRGRGDERAARVDRDRGRWRAVPRIGGQLAPPAPYAVPAPRDFPGRVGAGRFEYQGGYARQYAPARAWGRGQYLPQEYWGARVMDYREYRLRQPPYGYDWVAVGKDIYLMQEATGLILDALPGAY